VTRLRNSDLEATLAFLAEANSFDAPEPFPRSLLAALRRLVPGDFVSYCELDHVRKIPLWSDNYPVIENDDVEAELEIYWRLRPQHPVCRFEDGTSNFSALKISDFLNKAERRRREIYWEYWRPWEIEYQMSFGLEAPLSHTRVFIFTRSGGRDYTERDRKILNLLRPHLERIYETAQVRRAAREALALLDRTDAPIVVLERADQVAYASPEAQRLLATYFRASNGRLPREIAEWLPERRKTSSPEPLTVERGLQSVVVHLVDDSLLLEERQGASLLTARESEIVDLLAAGKTNAEIAELLWIAPGTVRKHLENVYEKLGVHSRTAAVAMVRSDRTFAAG
jgi:DNA-binding CsgD family transcriptional regulator